MTTSSHSFDNSGNLGGKINVIWRKNGIKGPTIRKVMGGGGRGIFEAQEFSSLSNSLYEFFLGHSMYIFRVNWRARIFFHLIFPSANFFFVLRTPPPPHKFSNGPSLRGIEQHNLVIKNLYPC